MIKIGVLELQGDFALHHDILRKIQIDSVGVKSQIDLEKVDGLIIPGGESTVISKLMNIFKLFEPICEFGKTNPVMGTCAGLILMAKKVRDNTIKSLGFLDLEVERNAYGRQINSSNVMVEFNLCNDIALSLPTTFIRAPLIKNSGSDVRILGMYKNNPIAVISDHFLGLTFHPELDLIDTFHRILFDKNSKLHYKKLEALDEA